MMQIHEFKKNIPVIIKENGKEGYALETETEIKLCQNLHKVDGQIPELNDFQFDGRTCDCGRMKYIVEDCGCPSNQTKELHGYPNQ